MKFFTFGHKRRQERELAAAQERARAYLRMGVSELCAELLTCPDEDLAFVSDLALRREAERQVQEPRR